MGQVHRNGRVGQEMKTDFFSSYNVNCLNSLLGKVLSVQIPARQIVPVPKDSTNVAFLCDISVNMAKGREVPGVIQT